MYFPLFSVFNRLFGNMTRRCLAQMSAPNNNNFTYLPPSYHHSFPNLHLFKIPANFQWLIIIYLLFVELEFSSYLIVASPKFFFGYTRLAEERVTYSVKFKNPGKNFCGLFILRPPYNIDFSSVL